MRMMTWMSLISISLISLPEPLRRVVIGIVQYRLLDCPFGSVILLNLILTALSIDITTLSFKTSSPFYAYKPDTAKYSAAPLPFKKFPKLKAQ